MVRRSSERSYVQRKAFDGEGEMRAFKILENDGELYDTGRLFNHCILNPGCEVGWHIHNGDGETYYIIRGEGEYNDNGTVTTLHTGDVAFCDAGEGHSIINRTEEPLELIALILYK